MFAAAALCHSHHCSQTRSLADGPFDMIDLPIPGSDVSVGLAEFTNNIRVDGSVTNYKITASFSLGHCISPDATCSAAAFDVPLVSGTLDFATFCQAF